jgi:hypothetical protein
VKVRYFEGFLKHLIEQSAHPGIPKVETLSEAGIVEHAGDNYTPVGLKLTLADGAQVVLRMVRGAPAGGNRDGMPDVFDPAALPAGWMDGWLDGVALSTGRPAKVSAVEADLKLLLERSGNAEVAQVRTFAEWGKSDKPVGLKVSYADGSDIYVHVFKATPAGDRLDRHADYDIPARML